MSSGIFVKYFDLFGTIGENPIIQLALILLAGFCILAAIFLIGKLSEDLMSGFKW